MSVGIQFHGATPATVDLHGGANAFLAIGIDDGTGNKVTLFFADQADAYDWLTDALAKVNVAATCHESDPHGIGRCEQPADHAGSHRCRHTDGETVTWPRTAAS